MSCYVCGDNAIKEYNGPDNTTVWEARYWKEPEKYYYCSAECSLEHYENGYQINTNLLEKGE